MRFGYYPGCTLRTKAKQLDYYARACAEKLDVELVEPQNWTCCGGVFVSARDEIASKLSSVRVLKDAKLRNEKLVTVCAACHNVLKQTNYAMKHDKAFSDTVNRYMSQDKDYSEPYNGEGEVIHYLELLRDEIGFDKVKEKTVNPLTGIKAAAYYGCMLLRPGRVMSLDNVENPTVMEDLLTALGAESIIYPMRNECCGGCNVLADSVSALKNSSQVIESAISHGAKMIVTACPLCKYNLEKTKEIPVVYLTELLAEAFGIKGNENEQ